MYQWTVFTTNPVEKTYRLRRCSVRYDLARSPVRSCKLELGGELRYLPYGTKLHFIGMSYDRSFLILKNDIVLASDI